MSHALVHAPTTDLAVRVTRKQSLPIRRPGQGGTVRLGGEGVLALRRPFGLQVVDHVLALQVPDLDTLGSGSAQPVTVGGEDEGVDDVPGIQGVKALAFVQVPEHGRAVLSARGAEGAIGGDGDDIQIPGVADQVLLELAVGKVPNLDALVPPARDDDRRCRGGGESDAGDPLGVPFVGDGEFALAQGVPKLDGLIPRAGNNLSVVRREGDRENVLGVPHESTGSLSGLDLPQAKGTVPRARQGKLPI